MLFDTTGGSDKPKYKKWSELQLPLYASYVEQHWGRAPEVGYFNLPRTVAATRIFMWDGLGQEARDSAPGCAEEIVRRVKDGVFWPPRRKSGEYGREGEFDRLFPRPEAELVDFSNLTGASDFTEREGAAS